MLDTKWRPATGHGGPEQAGHDGNRDPLNKPFAPEHQELADARVRLNESVDLLARGLDLIELLHCGIDMENAECEVAEFGRAVTAYRRKRVLLP